jgi:hypothetical protein
MAWATAIFAANLPALPPVESLPSPPFLAEAPRASSVMMSVTVETIPVPSNPQITSTTKPVKPVPHTRETTTTTSLPQETIELKQTIETQIAPRLGEVSLLDVAIRRDIDGVNAIDMVVAEDDNPNGCATQFSATVESNGSKQFTISPTLAGKRAVLDNLPNDSSTLYGTDRTIWHADNAGYGDVFAGKSIDPDNETMVDEGLLYIKQQHVLLCHSGLDPNHP